MKFKHRMKRTTKQYIVVALICIAIIGGAAVLTALVITNQIKAEYESQLTKAYKEMSTNQKSVYTAIADLRAGDIISEDRVKRSTVYSSQPQEFYITESEIGKLALIDIPVETNIMTTMVTDSTISSELREVEYQVININSNIISNDTVDVRLFFPNGEDYVVLPKKVLRGYTGETTNCCLWLTEEEIIRTRNAIVDAYLYTGAFLYTTKYIEPNIQSASFVTYTPSIGAIELIQKNPNILETATNDLSTLVRKALENRLAKSLKKDVASQQWELKDDYIYQQYPEDEIDSSVYDHGTEEIEKQEGTEEKPYPGQEPKLNSDAKESGVIPEKIKNGRDTPNNEVYPETGSLHEEDIKDITSTPDLGSLQSPEEMKIDEEFFMLREVY